MTLRNHKCTSLVTYVLGCMVWMGGFIPTAPAGMHQDPSSRSSTSDSVRYFRYYAVERIPLIIDTRTVAIFENSNSPAVSLSEFGFDLQAVRADSVGGWWTAATPRVLRSGDLIDKLIRDIAAADVVEFVSPVFRDGDGGPIMITPDVLVRFKANVSVQAAEDILVESGAGSIMARDWGGMKGAYRLRSSVGHGFAVLSAANALAERAEVKWAEPNFMFTGKSEFIPNDPSFGVAWHLHNTGQTGGTPDMDVDAPEAWELQTGSVIVAIVDTGVQQDHPDIHQIAGIDVTSAGTAGGGPSNVCDTHGTPVAGTVSAKMNNGLGTVGVAPDALSVSIKTQIAKVGCSSACSCCSAGDSDCCDDHTSPGCDDDTCETCVCEIDPFCCDNLWDGLCVEAANTSCLDKCECGGTGDGGCCQAGGNGSAGCQDLDCEECVCGIDPFCCDVLWDSICSNKACSTNTTACTGSFSIQTTWAIDSLTEAENFGARVSNHSYSYSSGLQSQALADKFADTRSNGMVHFASSGNTFSGGVAQIVYPASLSTVNSVAALDANGELTDFSNFGPGLDFSAPGIGVQTTFIPSVYGGFLGTSAAAPVAAGVAALVLSEDPSLTPNEVEDIMADSATDLGVNGYDETFGWGFVNAYKAVLLTNFDGVCPGAGSCFESNGTPGCDQDDCCLQICGEDSFCCNVDWDEICADEAILLCLGCGADAGNCTTGNGTPGCADVTCCATMCQIDPFCCNDEWDDACAINAIVECGYTPDNDDCSDALPIDDGVTPYGTVYSTSDGPPHAGCNLDASINGDIWYDYEASCTGLLTVSNCNIADTDTKIAVYDDCNCPVNEIGLLNCNDDGPGCADGSSEVSGLFVQQGDCYKIRIADLFLPQGGGAIEITCKTQFDDCENALHLNGFDGTLNFSTIGATTDGPPHSGCDVSEEAPIAQDIWYDYHSTCDGILTVSTCNQAGFDTKLAVYDGCECPATHNGLLDCNDNQVACGIGSEVTASVVSNACYKVRLGGSDELGSPPQGTGQVTFTCSPTCGSQGGDCCDPAGLGTPGCDNPDCCAVVCPIDPFCCGVEWDAGCSEIAEATPACNCTCSGEAEGTPCDDGDFCTEAKCTRGQCVGEYTYKPYGDIVPQFGAGQPDFDDILCILDGFSNPADCPDGDIYGTAQDPCVPNGVINFDDILAGLNAFGGNPECPDPCPEM